MRNGVTLAVLATLTALVSALPAQAQSASKRIQSIDVRPRSFLDAGKTAPVGTYNRYVTNSTPDYAVPFRGAAGFAEVQPYRFPRGVSGIPVDLRTGGALR
jgi:hypothetical protein